MSLLFCATTFLILYFFFSAIKPLFVSANRVHIEIEKHKNGIAAFCLNKITKNPPRFLSGMFLGEMISLTVLTTILISWINRQTTSNVAFFLSVFSVLAVLSVTTVVARSILLSVFNSKLIKIVAAPAYFFYLIFSLLADLLIKISNFISQNIFHHRKFLFYSGLTPDIGQYLSGQLQRSDSDEDINAEIQIFQNALSFSDIKAKEVMTPRTEITAVEIGSDVTRLHRIFEETGYSKILVYKNNLDHIQGYIHSFELFNNPSSITEILIPVIYIPKTMPIGVILKKLVKERKSIAVVIDEFGGTAGMVTTEDIVEELFGEIEDEHDSVDLLEIQLKESHYYFSARLEVDYINQNYNLNLPENDSYETLGGMIFYYAEKIPDLGEIIDIADFHVKILSVSNTRIDTVELYF